MLCGKPLSSKKLSNNFSSRLIPRSKLSAIILSGIVFKGRDDILIIYNDEDFIRKLNPDFNLLKDIKNTRGFIVTAPGDNYDFASRCFFPITGVDEDPVTGSAHTTLSAYWSKKLKKTSMNAVQLSPRGGELECHLENDRVFIGGNAKLFMKGTIYI